MLVPNILRVFCALGVSFALTAVTHASSADWENVKSLPPGTPISVKVKLRHLCDFESASDVKLVCSPKFSGPNNFTLSFRRNEVRQVRLEHSDDTNALIGMATAGSIGFALGASGHKTETGTRIVEGVVTGAIFGFVGRFMNRAFPITHRNVIYRRQ